jgi:hypothetical protein
VPDAASIGLCLFTQRSLKHIARVTPSRSLSDEVVHTPYVPARTIAGCSLVARTAIIAALLAPTALAQRHSGVITGTVKDESGSRVPNVEVTVVKMGTTVHTDSVGRFTFPSIAPGMFDVTLRRLPYSPMTLSLEVTEGDTTDVDITIATAADKLPTVVVKGQEERKRQLDAFEERRKLGLGHFVTRAQIAARGPLVLSEMLRGIPGAQLVQTNVTGRMTLRFARRNDCPPTYFVDGHYMPNFNIDDMPPHDVEGIELYEGFSGLPAEFAKQTGVQACGVVVIWTRIPGL